MSHIDWVLHRRYFVQHLQVHIIIFQPEQNKNKSFNPGSSWEIWACCTNLLILHFGYSFLQENQNKMILFVSIACLAISYVTARSTTEPPIKSKSHMQQLTWKLFEWIFWSLNPVRKSSEYVWVMLYGAAKLLSIYGWLYMWLQISWVCMAYIICGCKSPEYLWLTLYSAAIPLSMYGLQYMCLQLSWVCMVYVICGCKSRNILNVLPEGDW